MAFQTLNDILAHQFSGNYFSDMDDYDEIGEFLMRTDVPKGDRLQAYNHMRINAQQEPADESALDLYVEDLLYQKEYDKKHKIAN
jgi:hypothetical protein